MWAGIRSCVCYTSDLTRNSNLIKIGEKQALSRNAAASSRSVRRGACRPVTVYSERLSANWTATWWLTKVIINDDANTRSNNIQKGENSRPEVGPKSARTHPKKSRSVHRNHHHNSNYCQFKSNPLPLMPRRVRGHMYLMSRYVLIYQILKIQQLHENSKF